MYQFRIFAPYRDRIEFGLTPELFGILADQLHGATVLELDSKPATMPRCDGFMTNKSDLPMMVKVADCQGLLLYDPVTHSAAAIHSGWRGSAQNIIGKAVKKMRKTYGVNPADLLAAISPSLGPCCAQFSDPKNELPRFCHPFIMPNNHVDFWKLSKLQLQDVGVPEKNIEVAGICTKCRSGYPSHRNGDSRRMGVFVTLK